MRSGLDDESAREAALLLEVCGGDIVKALHIVEGQLNVLHLRAQVITSLASVVVTVTGFSGRIIAGANLFGQVTIVAGISVVLASAIWTMAKVMPIKWITKDLLGNSPLEALESIIDRRNRKTRSYQQGGVVLCVGIALYGMAVAQMLLNP